MDRTQISQRWAFLAFFIFSAVSLVGGVPEIAGSWGIDRSQSTAIDPWGNILLEIEVDGDAVTIERTVRTGRRISTATYELEVGKTVNVPIEWWTGNRHIGAYIGGDGTEAMRAEWLDERTLGVVSNYILATSQGETPVRSTFEYRLSPDKSLLTVIELRSSRDRPVTHVFKRRDS